MMRFVFPLLASLAAVALIAAGTPVPAQVATETGSILAKPAPARVAPGTASNDQARATLRDFARCTVLRHRRAAESALRQAPIGAVNERPYRDLAASECLENWGQLKFSADLMRGAMYEALYRADFGRSEASVAATPVVFDNDVMGDSSPEARQYLALRRFADCAVRADPSDSRALVMAPVATSLENDAFARMSPHFADCIAPGETFHFGKAVISGLIAEALYREAAAALPVSASRKL